MSTDSFIPYKFSYPLLWFTDFALPGLMKLVHNVDDIIVSESDRRMLKGLRDERVILVANHPSTKEPPLAFKVAQMMHSRFHYMAGREVFDWGNGLVGKLIQSIGAYSVLAGISDRESLKVSRQIIAKKAGKLALFPEGEPTGGENDNLLPFQAGAAQLAFWGFEDALKVDPDVEVTILPMYIKYRMSSRLEDIRRDVDRSLEVLERRFRLHKSGKTVVHRLLSIGKRMVLEAEKEFGLESSEEEDFDYRIGKLRHTILDQVAEKTGIHKWNNDLNAIDKLRRLLSTFEMVSIGMNDPKLKLPDAEIAKWGREFCQRAYDFISIQTDYLKSLASAERIYEWIYRIENEALGFTRQRPQNVHITFAKPYKISELHKDYKKKKRPVLEKLTTSLRDDIQTLLEQEKAKSFALFAENHTF
ncbi:MAG: lysophospholipid acyltransferase family protein [Spirochaetota bacterium]